MNRLLLLMFCALIGSCKNEIDTKSKDKRAEVFQDIIDSIYQENPESIGLMVHIESPKNAISWSGSAGYSDKEKQSPLKPDQPFLIASSIKTYISSTVLRLQEEGKLNIEDPIGNYLSEKTAVMFRSDGYQLDKIKIKHLLSHTSGIYNYGNDEYIEWIDKNQKHRWTRDEQIQLSIERGDPVGKPQEIFEYADVNYLLITEIIEEVTQKPFYTAMRELLKYDELNLSNTWFPTLEDKPTKTPELVHQYWTQKEFGLNKIDIAWDSKEQDISWDLYGGGGIATSVAELAQFSYHLFTGEIIEDINVLELIKTDVTTTDRIPKNYRLGLAEAKVKDLQCYGHGGFWGTIVFYIPELDASISVCVLERNGKMKSIKSTLDALASELETS